MDLMTESQLFALIICAALMLIAYKVRQPGISLVGGVGVAIVAFQIYNESESPDLLLLGLMMMLAISQFIIVTSHSYGRKG